MPNRDGTGPRGKGQVRKNQTNDKRDGRTARTTDGRGRCKRRNSKERRVQKGQEERIGTS